MGRLPARDRLLLRNGYVMTMEPGQADMAHADVLIEHGQITAIAYLPNGNSVTLGFDDGSLDKIPVRNL